MTGVDFKALASSFIKRDGINDLMQWLNGTDFYAAPASAKYHLSEVGGLYRHSIYVYYRLRRLCEEEAKNNKLFKCPSDETIAIVGLFHDLCKVNYYKLEMGNKKAENGKWVRIPIYQVNETFPLGHGEKSLYIVSRYMRLTEEEALSIRWHMGAWGLSDYRDLNNAMERYPLVALTQTADVLATYLDEVKV